MLLREYLADLGKIFFRWRSYTPLLLIPLFWLERKCFYYPEGLHSCDLAYEFACFAVAVAGLGVRIKTIGHVAKGTSGRNTVRQEAVRLNTTGMYSVVRNPLYLGNYLILLGTTLMAQSWELVVINSFFFGLAYLPIIMCEEEFLLDRFGPEYRAYAASTPCFIPRLRLWRPPDMPFNMQMVLYREHDTWMSTVTAFVFLEHLRDYVIMGHLTFDYLWDTLGVLVLLSWCVLKTLKSTGFLVERQQLSANH
jgi:protein-S-isoprenylcysteine O-methyltransferase Ste14